MCNELVVLGVLRTGAGSGGEREEGCRMIPRMSRAVRDNDKAASRRVSVPCDNNFAAGISVAGGRGPLLFLRSQPLTDERTTLVIEDTTVCFILGETAV